jgi:hypothetical protein
MPTSIPERVAVLRARVDERRNLRLGFGHQRGGLLDIELAHRTALVAHLGQRETLLHRLQVLLRDRDALFQRTQIDIGVGDIREQRHQRVVIRGFRHAQLRAIRFDLPAIFAPEVELPAGVHMQMLGPQMRGRNRADAARVDMARAHRHGARLRQQILLADGELRARLEDVQAGYLQRQVAFIRTLFERGEHRVVERGPPGRLCGGSGLRAVRQTLEPAVFERHVRLFEIRAHCHATAERRTERHDERRAGQAQAAGRGRFHRAFLGASRYGNGFDGMARGTTQEDAGPDMSERTQQVTEQGHA